MVSPAKKNFRYIITVIDQLFNKINIFFCNNLINFFWEITWLWSPLGVKVNQPPTVTSIILCNGLYISLFSPEFKMMLTTDAFGSDPSPDAIIIFEQFALVLGLLVLGIISLVYGSLSFTDINVLKRISFLLFALSGFFALPDLINVFMGQPTAPLPVIIMGLITLGLFYYGSKKGTI